MESAKSSDSEGIAQIHYGLTSRVYASYDSALPSHPNG